MTVRLNWDVGHMWKDCYANYLLKWDLSSGDMFCRPGAVYNLLGFSEWLQYEAWCQSCESYVLERRQRVEQNIERGKAMSPAGWSATILNISQEGPTKLPNVPSAVPPASSGVLQAQTKTFCPYYDKADYYLSQRPTFKTFKR